MLEVAIGRPYGGPFHTFGSDDYCGRSLWNDCEQSNWSRTSSYVLPGADSGGLAVESGGTFVGVESGGTFVGDGTFGRLRIGRI